MSNASAHNLATLRRELPGCSDDLWAWKGRLARPPRDELYLPSFRDLPRRDDELGCRARWRGIRELVDRWYGIAMPDAGHHDEAISRAEERVGSTLPYSLRECVAFARDLRAHGRLDEITRDGLWVERLGNDVAFCTLVEGNAAWVVEPAHLGLVDPPVYVSLIDEDGTPTREPTTPWASSVSGFVLQHLASYLKPCAGTLDAGVPDLDRTLDALARDLPVRAQIEDLHIFEALGVIVLVERDPLEGGWEARVRVHSRATHEHVPTSIRELRRTASSYGGLFL